MLASNVYKYDHLIKLFFKIDIIYLLEKKNKEVKII